MAIRAIIIEDEKSNRDNLNKLLENYCPEINMFQACNSAIEGRKAILEYKPELIFLDIEMPGGDGFSLLDSLPEFSFEVIFVTAHDQYAIRAIKACALDYLLKPIDVLELTHAVDKAMQAIKNKTKDHRIQNLINNRNYTNSNRIALPLSDKIEFVQISHIIRCQAEGNYTKFIVDNQKPLLVSQTLKEYDELLSEQGFMRVHQSHLVNITAIKSFIKKDGGYLKLLDDTSIPVSRQRKELVLAQLKLL